MFWFKIGSELLLMDSRPFSMMFLLEMRKVAVLDLENSEIYGSYSKIFLKTSTPSGVNSFSK